MKEEIILIGREKEARTEYERIEARFKNVKDRASNLVITAYRSVVPEYAKADDLISGKGSFKYGGRWNPPGIAAIYASNSPETAMAETLSHVRYYGLPVHSVMPRMFVALSFNLACVLDLLDGEIRQRLAVSKRRMIQTDWRSEVYAGHEPITQMLGRAVTAVGLEGILVPSSADPQGFNLVAFPNCFLSKSYVKVLE